MRPIASVVIPACNEAGTIGRCLRTLTDQMPLGELEIIVVCNGCCDNTAEEARAFSGVTVVETEIGNKCLALNRGDEESTVFPRFYLDADIRLTRESVVEIIRAFRDNPCLCATSPAVEFDFTGCSFPVRNFFRVWELLPYCSGAINGSGVYVLSEMGRSRFGAFPSEVADDEYVRRRFTDQEKARVKGAVSIVCPPRTMADLFRVRARQLRGNKELVGSAPGSHKHRDLRLYLYSLRKLLTRPWLWPGAVLYVGVNVSTHIVALRQLKGGATAEHWVHDASSRSRDPAK